MRPSSLHSGRVSPALLVGFALCAFTSWALAQQPLAPTATVPAAARRDSAARDTVHHTGTPGVEVTGVTSEVRIEHVLSGHLTSLNGRYKMRATLTVYEPGGSIGIHHHAGPGMRYVLAGELTYLQPGRTTVYRAGDWFYEAGDTVHTSINRSAARDTILNVELLPVDWFGPSMMPAPGAH